MEMSAHYGFNEKQLNIQYCDYIGCDEEATHLDSMGNPVCEDCMEREIQDDILTPEDFEEL